VGFFSRAGRNVTTFDFAEVFFFGDPGRAGREMKERFLVFVAWLFGMTLPIKLKVRL
jgi:hypothetical protein